MRTKEAIKKTITGLDNSAGRRFFTPALKQEIIDISSTMPSFKDGATYFSLHYQTMMRWKKELLGEVTVNAVSHGAHQQRFTLPTKIDIAKQILSYDKTVVEAAKLMEVGVDTITAWVSDYEKGLFVIENCTQITRKPIRTYTIIMVDIKAATSTLASLKDEAQDHLDKEYAARSAKLGAM